MVMADLLRQQVKDMVREASAQLRKAEPEWTAIEATLRLTADYIAAERPRPRLSPTGARNAPECEL
jgi:hypothetical protein